MNVFLTLISVLNCAATLGNVLNFDVFHMLISGEAYLIGNMLNLMTLLILVDDLYLLLDFFPHLFQFLHSTNVVRLYLALDVMQLRIFMSGLLDLPL